MKKSPFFDFMNRRKEPGFEQFLRDSVEDADYIDWNQFVLPMDYGNAEQEYLAIRNSCALFDVSPLRKYRICGTDSCAFLDYLLTRPASTMAPMRAVYVIFCNADGSVKDDAILHKYAEDDYLLLPSDMDHSAHFEALCEQRSISDVSISDCTGDWHGMAVQGPLSMTVMHHMGFENIEDLEPYAIRDYSVPAGRIRVVRMGFTGDLGYECWFQPELDRDIEQRIQSARESMDAEIPGYGLTALDACRLESGYIVAGWDCATEADPNPGFERTPFELGLDWLVNLDGADFFGREALLAERQSGPKYTLRSFEIDDSRKPEEGAEIFITESGESVPIGSINCSSWSWDLGETIGNASIESGAADCTDGWIRLEGDKVSLRLSPGPLRRFELSKQVPAPVKK